MFIEYTGRWEISETGASTTACGSSLRAGFYGETALLTFDLTGCEHPYPHVYVSIDGGAMTESVIAHYIRVRAEGDGPHEVSVIMKSSPETQDRWESPVAKVVFTGIAEADPAPVKADARPIIEFVGDSITEGSSIYPELTPFEGDRWLENLLYTNDVCSSYSYLTAKLLGWRGEFMGYGSTGVTCSGGGGVPPAAEAYAALRKGVPYTSRADHVVINSGANDRGTDSDVFTAEYKKLIETVRRVNPGCRIWIVTPFCGAFRRELSEIAEADKALTYIDTAPWKIPAEPLHPSPHYHRLAAEKLAAAIMENLSRDSLAE